MALLSRRIETMNVEEYRQTGAMLAEKLHLATWPVAVTYIRDEDEIPDGAVRPSAAGQKWSLCQAFTYARRWEWQVAMTAEDNFCVPGSAFHQWVDVSEEDIIESQVRQGWHKDRAAEVNRFNFTKNLFQGEKGKERQKKIAGHIGFVCSPLHRAERIPDAILVFGDGAQITHLIHALCYDYTFPVMSAFEGFGETCFKGGLVPYLTGHPQVVIPGMGDRSFSGVSDHEIAIGVPASLLPAVRENLFKTGGRMNMGYPVKPLLPSGLTESLTPGFAFLKSKVKPAMGTNEDQ
jgi:uncharacterized protein (DUF169 family)